MSMVTFKNVSAYLAGSTGKPGIILIQEWWGLAGHIKSLADKFAAQGFQVIAPDLYHGKVTKDADEANHLMSGLNFKAAVGECKIWVDYLKSERKASKVGVTGLCMGGALTIACASSFGSDIGGAAVFYGIPDLTVFPVSSIDCALQLHFGEKDSLTGFSSPSAVQNLVKHLQEAHKTFELREYPNAEHAFMNEERPEVYRPDDAKHAFNATVKFFTENLK